MKNFLTVGAVLMLMQSTVFAKSYIGKLDHIIEDSFKDHKKKEKFFLETTIDGKKQRVLLDNFKGSLNKYSNNSSNRSLSSGDTINVDGNLGVNGTLTVESIISIKSSFNKNDKDQIVSKPVFLVLTFDDNPIDLTEKMNKVMESVKKTYKEASYGQKDFVNDSNGDGKPDVVGSIKVTGSINSCEYSKWADEADKIAADKFGTDFGIYNHRVYIFDKRAGCGWGGLASVGCVREKTGGKCRSWLNSHSSGIFVHELGHNLGLVHASKDGKEYGDKSDPQGAASLVFFNAPHTDKLKWFDKFEGSIKDIELLDNTDEEFEIYPISTLSDDKELLKTLRFGKNGQKIYYISLRTREGLDKKIRGEEYIDRVTVHSIGRGGRGNSQFIKSLKDGESWSSPEGKFKIIAEKGNSEKSKKVRVEFESNTDK